MRQAILSANAATGQDSIQFSITLPAAAVAAIAPLTPLPDLTEAVSILAYSQAGSVKNSLATGFNAVLRIRLSGTSAGAGASGLVVKAAGVSIDGLVIDGFGGAAVQVQAGAAASSISVTAGATTQVEGMLASLPSQTCRLQVFRSATLNGSGRAEGQTFLGETTVTTDAADHAFWTVTLPAVAPGTIVGATATRRNGTTHVETSEFSPGLAAGVAAAPTITAVTPPSGPSTGGTVLTVSG